jgi:hypothetical protein
MFEHAGHHHVGAVADRVDVDFRGVTQVAVDQHRAVTRHLHRSGDIMLQLRRAVDDLHRPPAQHIARPQQHRIADPLPRP